MTALLLVFTTQALDAFGLALALPVGTEQNPLMAALLATGGIGAVVALKLAAGLGIGAILARRRPSLAPLLGLVGCVGCLSELLAVAAR